jgi:hypothetical protein
MVRLAASPAMPVIKVKPAHSAAPPAAMRVRLRRSAK